MPTSYFKGVTNYGDTSILENLATSTILWMDWCFLNIGAFSNYRLASSGNYGGNFSQLRHISDPRYSNGKVWETPRSNLVWESGMNYPSINVSGIYVDGSLVTSGFTLNYPLGRVVFDTAINPSSVVKMEYSSKQIKILDSNNLPFFRKGQTDSFGIQTLPSGQWSTFPESRLQYPLIAIETAQQGNFKGFEIGSDTLEGKIAVYAHIVGETKEVDRIANILANQKDTKYYLIDEKMMVQSGKVVLDYNGAKTNTTSTYPEIVAENSVYRGRETYVTNSSIEKNQVLAPDLYKRSVKLQIDIIF